MEALKTKPTLIIAPAKDMSDVIALAHRIWPVAYANILTPEQISNMLEKIYNPENLRTEIADGHRFWIAYDDGKPVGYGSSFKKDNVIWLKKLYIDMALQGRGIGEQLLEAVTAAWHPAREIHLLVNPYNTPAQRFYERCGFEKIGTIPVRMGDWNFDDFLYARTIK